MSKSNENFKKLIQKYKELGAKKFFEKWKLGIDNISPMQFAKSQLVSSIPVIIGLIIGICVTKTFWILLCLIGGLVLIISQSLGQLQKFLRLKIQDKIMKGEFSVPINKQEVSNGHK